MGESETVQQLIIVSNRLPVSLEYDNENETWCAQHAAGGLVSALEPVMSQRSGIWIGWPGVADESAETLQSILKEQLADDLGYQLKPVALSEDEVGGFYEGFSNEILWPLFHNFLEPCKFNPDYWQSYQQVNHRFAAHVAEAAQSNDFIWVHDYHLLNVAAWMRELGMTSNRCGFFLHIPFPPVDIFRCLPWWRDIMRALLSYDFIGLQTANDRRHFIEALRALFKRVQIHELDHNVDIEIDDASLVSHKRRVRVSALPISIDYQHIETVAGNRGTDRQIEAYREEGTGQAIVLGIDRLDYTKGLPEKFMAFRELLQRHPELHGRIVLEQHVIPSRQQLSRYAEQKVEIERLVGQINGEFTAPGWVPIHYAFESMIPAELMAHYQVADIALVTPLKDGMNLVAKEFCAAQLDDRGVLILSEFAGAADELGEQALLVNPYDRIATAESIYTAFYMADEEQRTRMQSLRKTIRDYTVFDWVQDFLHKAAAED